ncbi:MAG TPA: hypothetical protein VMS00_04830 [Acidimicrobiales bacterium]|nr:hypothetical protein [Acidimicrobiales bacterium]
MQTLWAEDGMIFYSQALVHSFWRTLITAYNGYDQLAPRLIIQLTKLAPVADASTVVALCGAGGLAALGCLVFHMSRGHLASPALRGLLVAATVALPLANVEMLNNLVNLPWWLFFAAFWALLWRPETTVGRVTAGLVCCLAAASEPLVGVFVPLAAFRVWALPRLKEQPSTVGLAIGLVYQGAVVLGSHGENSFPKAGVSGLPADFALRVGLGWLSGLRGTDAVVRWDRPLAEVLGGVLFASIVVAGLKLGSKQGQAFVIATAVMAPICFAVPVWLRGSGPFMQLATTSVGYGGRYAATSILMLVSAVLVLAGHLSTDRRRRAPAHFAVGAVAAPSPSKSAGAAVLERSPKNSTGGSRVRWAFVACCVLLLPAWVADFRDANGRAHGPTWQSQLSVAVATCRTETRGSMVDVVIVPPRWTASVPCRDLRSDGRRTTAASAMTRESPGPSG